MNILIDMNLSPDWVKVFENNNIKAVHWSSIGDPSAPDKQIMSWAKDNGFIVFTHDLDFGAILASTNAEGPSVIQVRTQDVSPQHLSAIVLKTLKQYSLQLEKGALIGVDEIKSRIRILPVNRE